MVSEYTIDMGEIWEGWEGQWARIKPYQSYASQQRIEQAAYQGSMNVKERDTMRMHIQQVEAAVAWVEEQVVEWNLLGYDGNEIQPNRAGVTGELTPPDLVDQLVGAMSDYYEAQRPPIFREPKDEAD